MDDFRELVMREGGRYWRELPWRGIDDAYGVLVSEVMLQQTQVKRVLGRWERFMDTFPTVDALAAADMSVVLEQWQGLGYNRRAIALKRAAQTCSFEFGGKLPCDEGVLMSLPGIGPATAAGVMAFAYDVPCVYLETNVRSVFIHHFFPEGGKVPDSELRPLVQAACPQTGVRTWYYALLDYGAHLKKTVSNPSRRSAHYTRQSAFEGSRRQKRAFIVRAVLGDPGIAREQLKALLDESEREAGRGPVGEPEFEGILHGLMDEGFFEERNGGLRA